MIDTNSDPFETSTCDLSQESSVSLEVAGQRIRRYVLRLGLKRIGSALCLLIIGVFVIFVITHGDISHLPRLLKIASGLLGFLFALIGLFALIFGLCYLVYSFFMLFQIPKAKCAPELTLKHFITSCLGGFHRNFPSAWVCLLDSAKKHFGAYDKFVEYWTRKRTSIIQNASSANYECIKKGRDIRDVSFFVADLNIIRKRAKFCEVAATIKLEYTDARARTVNRDAWFKDTLLLAQVGKRWYLISGKWGAKPVTSP